MIKLFKNKIILFIVSRYLSYVIQFANSLLIAYVLGPYYLGVWGFLSLILQYLNFGNFGLDIALNVSLSTGDLSDTKTQSKTASNAFFATTVTSIIYLIVAVALTLFGTTFFEKYMFTQYLLIVVVISCLNYFNVLFLNIFRTYSLFTPISIFQTIVQLFQLPVIFFFKDTQLIYGVLIMMIIAHVISFSIFLRVLPVKIKFEIDKETITYLYKRGASLLAYALTFYILLLSTRSMIGYFYPVETMGLFTFVANISAALIVGLNSLEFVLFPKMLNRLSADEINEKSIVVFTEVRYIYMATAFLIVVIGLLFYPVLLLFFKDYQSTVDAFSYLVLSQILISSGFGYSTLIISRSKEFFLVVHGIIALCINLALSFVCFYWLKIDYSIMALLLVFAFLYYHFQVIRKGRELLKQKSSFVIILKELLPVKTILSTLFILAAVITKQYYLFYSLALVAFIILNAKGYALIKKYVALLFHEPSVVNIK